MSRKPLTRLSVVAGAVAVVAAFALDGCGGHTRSAGSTGSSPRTPSGGGAGALTVHPGSGRTTTAFTFGFTVPNAAGRTGKTQLGYELAVLGPAHAGCLGARSAGVPALTAGAQVSITLDPAQMGGRWCPGTYRARVTETATPVCAAGTMCPQFIRIVGIVATGTFRVLGP